MNNLNKKVPFFYYPHIYQQHESELHEIMVNVAKRGAFILQEENKKFELNLASYLKSKYTLGVANCTDGLLLLLRAANIGKGDEVIFCSHTFVATASAIYHSGATPIPVECNSKHLIDIKSIEASITSRTKAIVPTQLNGMVCDMDEILQICEKYNLILIEDAAQSLGASYKGKMAGTFGLGSAFSFYPAKVIGCFGDGGAVATQSQKIFDQVSLLRDHGRGGHGGEPQIWGLNSRLDNFHAAILDFKLSDYPNEIKRRRSIAELYIERLNDVQELTLPQGPNDNKDKFEVFQNFEVEAEKRDSLRDYLAEYGVGTILQWGGKAVHQFEGLGFKIKLPFTEELMKKMFLLPMNTSLSDEDIIYVTNIIRKFYGYSIC